MFIGPSCIAPIGTGADRRGSGVSTTKGGARDAGRGRKVGPRSPSRVAHRLELEDQLPDAPAGVRPPPEPVLGPAPLGPGLPLIRKTLEPPRHRSAVAPVCRPGTGRRR